MSSIVRISDSLSYSFAQMTGAIVPKTANVPVFSSRPATPGEAVRIELKKTAPVVKHTMAFYGSTNRAVGETAATTGYKALQGNICLLTDDNNLSCNVIIVDVSNVTLYDVLDSSDGPGIIVEADWTVRYTTATSI